MDITPFTVYYGFHNSLYSAEIRPCCREDHVVDYAVWIEHLLAFTITKQLDTGKWVIALKNADDDIDNEMAQIIGAEIEKKLAHKN
jgi:hypothetical protein